MGRHVLVVDDDPHARALLDAVLRYGGALVTLAASARAALPAIRRTPPDVVVATVDMADEDGYWLVRELRARHDSRTLPIVALAIGRDHEADRTLGAGFNAHLRKPVDPWELCRIVAELAHKA